MVKDRRRLALSWLAFAFLPGLLATARADWAVTALERQPGAAGEIEYRRYSLGKAETGTEVEVRLALFSSKTSTLRMIDQPNSETSLAEIMTRENCLAGVNGGYFDPAGAPVGLLVSGGKTIAPFRRAGLLSGVVAARPGRVEIFRAREFPARKNNWREAVQCGPFLIDAGKSVAGLNDTRAARRTFVLTTTDRRAAIGSCAAVTLAQLAHVLTALSQLRIGRALNLDGGSSSAFWCGTAGQTVSLPELKPVRDFVAIVPRPVR